jgi:hypothetical protein
VQSPTLLECELGEDIVCCGGEGEHVVGAQRLIDLAQARLDPPPRTRMLDHLTWWATALRTARSADTAGLEENPPLALVTAATGSGG